MKQRWFDAHLDLACLAENGRDMFASLERCGGPAQPAVTLGSLAEGGVAACLATIFTEPDGNDAVAYPAGDSEAVHAAGVRQLVHYQNWQARGGISLALDGRGDGPGVLRAGLLIEGAEPVRSVEELAWWVERGVVAVGLAWARPSRYSGGNSTPEVGLSDLGRAMVAEMDRLGVVHDVSHLSDLAMDEVFTRASGRVMASHSNARALLGGENQRHLRDESMREIAQRGGVIGLNLFRKFVDPPGLEGKGTVMHAVDLVEHVCSVVGHRRAVGLGSDLDGGFGADQLPAGIRVPADYEKLAGELSRRGWNDAEVEGFAWGNWARFWGV
ncbi:MAG TPA: membrane dipeptidase [Phycisphaerales bacterium]|nr:membrane dipeptidase [Phycisphaerales bacterium]